MSANSTPTSILITDQKTISSYNRGPITSVFAPPASCTATLTFTDGNPGALFFGHFAGPFDKGCYPTGTDSAQPLQKTGAWNAYYYSPAICPSGWTAATTFQSSVPINPAPSFFVLGSETTAALCCPSGYKYHILGHICTSTITSYQNIVYVLETFDGTAWIPQTTATGPWISETRVAGDGIPIMWQSSDAALLARASTLTPTIQSTITIASSIIPSSTTISSQPHGLSTGAKIGIGVSIPLAIIAGLVVGLLLWKKRRGRYLSGEKSSEYDGMNTGYSDMPLAQADGTGQIYEMDNTQGAHQGRYELPGAKQASHELPEAAHR